MKKIEVVTVRRGHIALLIPGTSRADLVLGYRIAAEVARRYDIPCEVDRRGDVECVVVRIDHPINDQFQRDVLAEAARRCAQVMTPEHPTGMCTHVVMVSKEQGIEQVLERT